MTNRTKLQLEDAFKKLLLEKPFHKITIKDLTDACYLSRMSFYYHFQDLYDLTEWIWIEDAKKALNEKKRAEMEIRKTKKEVKARIEKMRDKISQMFLLGSLSGIAVLGDVIREYLLVNLIVLFVFVNMGIILIRMYLRKSM